MRQPTLAELQASFHKPSNKESIASFHKRMKSLPDVPESLTPIDLGTQTGIQNCNSIVTGHCFHSIMSDSSGEY